ncbi:MULTISPECIES: super-infection exclusion protein B [unclassified Serratia (in: enterobacteria)]|uniref:super-infection exclusion protein B n=1 Tax=unclassified Serratia (in: enterobacteria) TaxID=2647522 RepID=UPI00046A0E21|nr:MULTISPECIES: super-infection exclusion protein B [unclassified Serratia (in: enterobacteria)]
MPEWISAWVAKIFGSEPVVKVMYVLIVWIGLVLLSPESATNAVEDKVKIPYISLLIIFAIAFAIVDAAQRALTVCRSCLAKRAEAAEQKTQAEKEHSALMSMIEKLDEAEKSVLKPFVMEGCNTFWLDLDDVAVTSLSQQRILCSSHRRRIVDRKTQIAYRIDAEYRHVVDEYFKDS